jgi:hypothetical protein
MNRLVVTLLKFANRRASTEALVHSHLDDDAARGEFFLHRLIEWPQPTVNPSSSRKNSGSHPKGS